MTGTLKRFRNPTIFFLVVFELYVAGVLIALHADPSYQYLIKSIALPFDLMVFVPALFYVFIIRKYRLTPLLVLPVCYLGGLVVTQIIQPADLTYVLTFAFIMLLVEITIVVREFIRFVRRFKEIHASSDDPFFWFSESFYELFRNRRVAKLVSMELSTMYYAFFTWKKTRPETPGVKYFSYHEKSGYSSLIAVLIGVSVIEIVVMHMLLSMWSVEAALVVTILSVYLIFWLLGDLRASILRPVKVEGTMMEINSGIRVSVRVPLNMIESLDTKDPRFDKKETLKLGALGNCDCWIVFKEDIEIEGFFGKKQTRRAIGLSLDDTAGFKKAIKESQE